jgi:hypothetical protein
MVLGASPAPTGHWAIYQTFFRVIKLPNLAAPLLEILLVVIGCCLEATVLVKGDYTALQCHNGVGQKTFNRSSFG